MYDADHQMARPGARSFCPSCGGGLLAKCGPIVTWHWAHLSDDCDAWSEPETPWHLSWKRYLESQGAAVEVVMGAHRADAVMPNGRIVELQASFLSAEDIRKRETFYGDRLTWIYRVLWFDRIHRGKRGFWWKHGSKAMATHRRPVWWDYGLRVHRVSLGCVETETGSMRVLGRDLAIREYHFDRPSVTEALP